MPRRILLFSLRSSLCLCASVVSLPSVFTLTPHSHGRCHRVRGGDGPAGPAALPAVGTGALARRGDRRGGAEHRRRTGAAGPLRRVGVARAGQPAGQARHQPRARDRRLRSLRAVRGRRPVRRVLPGVRCRAAGQFHPVRPQGLGHLPCAVRHVRLADDLHRREVAARLRHHRGAQPRRGGGGGRGHARGPRRRREGVLRPELPGEAVAAGAGRRGVGPAAPAGGRADRERGGRGAPVRDHRSTSPRWPRRWWSGSA